MPKSYFLPADEPGKLKWLNNFAAKLPTYAATVGVTAAEVTQTTADAAYFRLRRGRAESARENDA